MRYRIKDACHSRGYKVADLCKKLGLYKSNLSLVDSGKRKLSISKLEEIIKFLGCSFNDIISSSNRYQKPYDNPEINRKITLIENAQYQRNDKAWVFNVFFERRKFFDTVEK